MVDKKRFGAMDTGRSKLRIPEYSSTNYISTAMTLDEAISTLDDQLKVVNDFLNNKIDTKEHNTLLLMQGGQVGEYYHLTELIHSSLIGYEGHDPNGATNPFVVASWVVSKIAEQAMKVAWGYVTLNTGTFPRSTFVNYVTKTSEGGAFYHYPDPWVTFVNKPGIIISQQKADGQTNTDHHGWWNDYQNVLLTGFTIRKSWNDLDGDTSYWLAVGV